MRKKDYLCPAFIYVGIRINSGLKMKMLLAQHSSAMTFHQKEVKWLG